MHKKWIVTYEVTREYGGPEEGGWGYDHHWEAMEQMEVNADEALFWLHQRQIYWYPQRNMEYTSVIAEDPDIRTYIEDTPGEHETKVRPHYE